MDARDIGRGTEVATQRLVPDLNGKALATTVSHAIDANIGDIAASSPPLLFVSIRREGLVIWSSYSIPSRTPRIPWNTVGSSLAYSGPVPEHLASSIHEWVKAQGTIVTVPRSQGFLTPQAKKLTIIQEARRTYGLESSSQQRATAFQLTRESPRRTPSIEAIRGPLWFGTKPSTSSMKLTIVS